MSSGVSSRQEVIVVVESDSAPPHQNESAPLIGKAQETCHIVQQIAKILFASLVTWSVSYWVAKAIADNPGVVIGGSIMGGGAGGYLAIKYWVK